MRKDSTDGQTGRDHRPGDRWRPLAQHLAARVASNGNNDEKLIGAAIAAIVDAEHRLGSEQTDFAMVAVPLAVSALRCHRRKNICRRRSDVRASSTIQLAIMAAERELTRTLRRSPTIAEVGSYLDVAQHQIIAGLEVGWSAISGAVATQPETAWRHPTNTVG